MDYGRTLEALAEWADSGEDVRALVLTGSAAAGTEHALSDRDIEVFTTDVPALVVHQSWWSGLGNVLVVERLQDGEGNPTRLAYCAGGKIDFTVLPARQPVRSQLRTTVPGAAGQRWRRRDDIAE
ncbi:aminoglycoside 6-adenylyltransferase [Rhodococcus sp. NPDC057014]|uniref:aminoglycoside 6-adenylyltransferase n=1 Tax=Rhodococcus sp. NPDC057014 TaxID=3346000 RepID=UPI0036360584